MKSKREISIAYIDFLQKGNLKELLGLFAENGKVDSPLYGEMNADGFYRELESDTTNSELKLKGIFEEEDSDSIALYFNYKWTMKNNELVEFDVVDIIEFNEANQITKLKIIYDTFKSRAMLRELRS